MRMYLKWLNHFIRDIPNGFVRCRRNQQRLIYKLIGIALYQSQESINNLTIVYKQQSRGDIFNILPKNYSDVSGKIIEYTPEEVMEYIKELG